MRYLWEVMLEAQKRHLSEEMLRFVHRPGGSAYMELSLPYLNQDWPETDGREEDIKESDEDGGKKGAEVTVGINTYYRFYSIFKDMFPPDGGEFQALRESLTNLSLHMLGRNDILKGMVKEDYYKMLLGGELEGGNFGEMARAVFLSMDRQEKGILLAGWLNCFRVGSVLPVFIDLVSRLVGDSIVYHSNDRPDEIYVYTGLRKERALEQRITFLVETFLDVRYRAEVFYEYHFGIIGVDETMRIDEIAIC